MNPHQIAARLAEISRIIAYWNAKGDDHAAMLEVRARVKALHQELQDALDRELIAAELRDEGQKRLPMSEYQGGGCV